MTAPTDGEQSEPEPAPTPTRPNKEALYGLGGVIVGAILAGIFGLTQTLAQLSGTTAESLRTQRQAAYTQFLTDHDSFEQSIDSYYLLLTTTGSNLPDVATVSAGYATVNEAYKKVTLSTNAVEVGGTLEAAVRADRILASDQVVYTAATASNIFNINPILRPDLQKMIEKLGGAIGNNGTSDKRLDFANQARHDVTG